MGWLWEILVDDEDFVRRVQREIERSEIIIEIEQKIDAEKRRSRVESLNDWNRRLNGIEERINKLEKYSLNLVPPKAMTETAVDLTPIQNDIKQIQVEQQRMSLRMVQLEEKVDYPQSTDSSNSGNNTNLQVLIDTQGREIETLKRNFDAQAQENTALKQQVSQQEQLLLNLDKQKGSLEQELAVTKHQLDLLQKQVANLVSNVSVLTPISEPTVTSPSSPVVHWIKSFSLPKPITATAFFHGDGEGAKAKLAQSIQDMDALINYLSKTEIEEPARTSFMKNLRWCKQALQKFYEKFNFKVCDADELSEELTVKFFKIISENLLDNVMVAIYRGGKNIVGYEDFLQNINRYLSNHGIYTQDIVPGMRIKGDMISNIEPPIAKQTSVSSDDNKVDEVELLPYFMYYEDDDGNLETVRKRGRVVCLKYGA